MDPDHILLSCTFNMYAYPQPVFSAQEMPVEIPAHIRDAELSDDDLFFLRWVLENHFNLLTDFISEKYPQYRIHLTRPEKDVSWESYRSSERGFLVWLVKSKEFRNDPVSILKSALLFYKQKELANKTSPSVLTPNVSAENLVVMEDVNPSVKNQTPVETSQPCDNESKVAALVAQQLDLVRSNLRKCFQDLQDVEALVNEIWTFSDKANTTLAESTKVVNDWCVVDEIDSAGFKSEKPVGLLKKVKHATKMSAF